MRSICSASSLRVLLACVSIKSLLRPRLKTCLIFPAALVAKVERPIFQRACDEELHCLHVRTSYEAANNYVHRTLTVAVRKAILPYVVVAAGRLK